MTKTKSQKARAKAMKMVKTSGKQRKQKLSRKDISLLNGNSFSFLNNSLGKQKRQYVSAPTAKSYKGLASRAKITTRGSGVTNVKHSEFVADISNNELDFTVGGMQINPGNIALFPWLASIAARFESYKFQNLCFRYETTSPTSTAGSVILAVDYNPNAVLPDSKTKALAMESSVRVPPWNRTEHRSLKHNLSKRTSYYIRNGDSVTDPDLYDVGTVMVMTEGVPSESGSLGELHVDYDVDLLTPTLTNSSTSGSSVFISAQTDSPPKPRYLLEHPDSDLPDGAPFEVGPGIHAPLSDMTLIGAVRFYNPGIYIVSFMCNGGPGLPSTDWAYAATDGINGPNTLEVVELIPGDGTAVLYDSVRRQATAQFVVRVTDNAGVNVQPMFGWGSTATTTDTSPFETYVSIAPFEDQTLMATAPFPTLMGPFKGLKEKSKHVKVLPKQASANTTRKIRGHTRALSGRVLKAMQPSPYVRKSDYETEQAYLSALSSGTPENCLASTTTSVVVEVGPFSDSDGDSESSEGEATPSPPRKNEVRSSKRSVQTASIRGLRSGGSHRNRDRGDRGPDCS